MNISGGKTEFISGARKCKNRQKIRFFPGPECQNWRFFAVVRYGPYFKGILKGSVSAGILY